MLRLRPASLAPLLLVPGLFACESAPGPAPDGGADAEVADAGTDAGPRPPDVCDELGLPRLPFETRTTGNGFGEIAGDFLVHTTAGDFRLSEQWTGCESYVFLVYFPDLRSGGSGVWEGDALFNSLPDDLFGRGPRNVHYFFTSWEDDAGARAARMDALAVKVEDSLSFLFADEADRAFWRARTHYVTDRVTDIEGSVGAHLNEYLTYMNSPESRVDLGDRGVAPAPLPFAFAIDRAQRFDPVDNLAPYVGANANFAMASYVGDFYNHLAALDARLAAEEGVREVTLVEGRTTQRTFTVTVDLPDAAAMASMDTLEVDFEETCDAGNPFACSEWDRIGWVWLCEDETCASRREVARWITPYWRRGRYRWAIDASPMLGMLREGGRRTFFVEMGPDWERATERVAHIALRFRAAGGLPRATGAVLAYNGGAFNADYNASHAPFRFTPPAGASRVELVTILSGHGQESGNNCAEWCDHRHTFSVNGSALPTIAHEGRIGSDRGCAEHAAEGWLPGQWGNGAPERAYWCPGLPVEAVRTDITGLVTLGAENELSYAASYRTGAPAGGDIALSTYVVWYED